MATRFLWSLRHELWSFCREAERVSYYGAFGEQDSLGVGPELRNVGLVLWLVRFHMDLRGFLN